MNMMLAVSAELGGAFSAARWAYAGKMTLLGMLMIFSVLGLLWGVLALFKIFFGGKSKKAAKAKEQMPTATAVPEPTVSAAESGDDLALIAVLTAAVSAYREAEGESGDFRVVSFRRASGGRAWNSQK